MTSLSKNILTKLQELEDSARTPFAWTEKLSYSTLKNKYTRTQFIHFDKGLWAWELNFFGGKRFVKTKVELEISQQFLSWIKKFKPLPKEALIKQLLEEDDDVLKVRCQIAGSDFAQIRKSIENEMRVCFKNLK